MELLPTETVSESEDSPLKTDGLLSALVRHMKLRSAVLGGMLAVGSVAVAMAMFAASGTHATATSNPLNTNDLVFLTEERCKRGGEGCLETQCCQEAESKCFKKNEWWADCKTDCTKGEVDPNTPEDLQEPWSCEVLGGACSRPGDGCKDTKCCIHVGHKCYQKNEHWADCKQGCEPGEVDPNSPIETQDAWTCKVLVPEGVCSEPGDGCNDTKCCIDLDYTCYKKDEHWADCKQTCEPGKVDPNSPEDTQAPWNCTELLPPDRCRCAVDGDGSTVDKTFKQGELAFNGTCSDGKESCCTERYKANCDPADAN